MEHNSEFSMQDVMRLAQSPAGQQLIALLKKQDSPQLQNAISSAAAGDYEQARKALSSLMDSPEIQSLLQQLGR